MRNHANSVRGILLASICVVSFGAINQARADISILNQSRNSIYFCVAYKSKSGMIRNGWWQVMPGSIFFFNTSAVADSTIAVRLQENGNEFTFNKPSTSYYYHPQNGFHIRDSGNGTYYVQPQNMLMNVDALKRYGYRSVRFYRFGVNDVITVGNAIPIGYKDISFDLTRSWNQSGGKVTKNFDSPQGTRIIDFKVSNISSTKANFPYFYISSPGRVTLQVFLYPGNFFDRYRAWYRGKIRIYYK